MRHLVRHAAEQEALGTGHALVPDHDQVRAYLRGQANHPNVYYHGEWHAADPSDYPTDDASLDRLARNVDSVRYKALGNAIATPVLSWIGKRIQAVS